MRGSESPRVSHSPAENNAQNAKGRQWQSVGSTHALCLLCKMSQGARVVQLPFVQVRAPLTLAE